MIRTMIEGDRLVLHLSGKVDSSNAAEFREQIRSALAERPDLPWLMDAQNLEYISSAGLRVLLRLKQETRADMTIRNVSPQIYETLSMTGFTEIMNVQRQLRRISVEGCPVIGQGAIGTVYRLDADTIVKVFEFSTCLPDIEKEQKKARQALVRGIPTAIAYDIVRVGDKYGAVYEMLKADNCNDLIVREPARMDEVIAIYAALLKKIHSVEMQPGEFPDAREVYCGYLDALKGILPDGILDRVRALIMEMPPELRVIHGDVQMKNVMLSDQEPMIIDMEMLCVGNPVFDFAGLWMAYCAFDEDDPGNSMAFLGIQEETSQYIYQKVVSLYFGDDPAIQQKQDKIQVLGVIRFLYIVLVMGLGKQELKEIRLRRNLERLEALLERVDALAL